MLRRIRRNMWRAIMAREKTYIWGTCATQRRVREKDGQEMTYGNAVVCLLQGKPRGKDKGKPFIPYAAVAGMSPPPNPFFAMRTRGVGEKRREQRENHTRSKRFR